MVRRLARAGAAALALNLVAVVAATAQTATSAATETGSTASQSGDVKSETAPPASAAAADPTMPTATPAVVETPPPPPPVDPLLAEVRRQLGDTKGADRGDRAALTAFYAERGNGPLVWVGDSGFNARARHAMAEIAKADDWGLSAARLPPAATRRRDARRRACRR